MLFSLDYLLLPVEAILREVHRKPPLQPSPSTAVGVPSVPAHSGASAVPAPLQGKPEIAVRQVSPVLKPLPLSSVSFQPVTETVQIGEPRASSATTELVALVVQKKDTLAQYFEQKKPDLIKAQLFTQLAQRDVALKRFQGEHAPIITPLMQPTEFNEFVKTMASFTELCESVGDPYCGSEFYEFLRDLCGGKVNIDALFSSAVLAAAAPPKEIFASAPDTDSFASLEALVGEVKPTAAKQDILFFSWSLL